MKQIMVPPDFKQADGTTFRMAQRDEEGNVIPKRDMITCPKCGGDAKGNIVRDPQGNLLIETRIGTFADVLGQFINGIFVVAQQKKETLTIQDSSFALDILGALHVIRDGVLELENAPFDWLIEKVNKYGVDVFPGANAALIKRTLENKVDITPARSERRRAEKVKAD